MLIPGKWRAVLKIVAFSTFLTPLTQLLPSAQELPPLSAEIKALIEEARALDGPEFSADILLRLAGSTVIADPAWKRQLIEEAFRAGAYAYLPYRKAGEDATDARASRAHWDNGLEALTLQTRAVEAMLELDPQRARWLFEDIPPPQVAALTCQETGAPNLSAYYQTAGNVFARSFSAEQRDKLEHLQFLKRVVGKMQSPADVTPAMKLILTQTLSAVERQELVADFSAALPRINGTPRVFDGAAFRLVPVTAPVKLPPGIRPAAPLIEAPPGQLPPQVVETAAQLLPALRTYILRYVSGSLCSETIRAGQAPSVVNDFNFLVMTLDPNASAYKPISPAEAKPARDAGTYDRHYWWMSDRSKRVMDALKWLNHGNRRDPSGGVRFFTPEERTSDEWNAHFVDALRLVEGWNAIEESSSEDWFGMVSETYQSLADKAPPGRQRDAAMTRYLNFMETHYAIITNHNLWFTQLHNLWRSKDPWIVEQLSNSVNPVISLYTRVNKRIAE
jgi:hypothetical protein